MPNNVPQQLFLRQARSDYEIFEFLSPCDICHRLHYLQMCMEKLAKVYFWRSGQSPGFRHDKFEPLLRDLDTTRTADFYRMFGYQDQTLFNQQKHTIFDLGTRIQNLVPAGGNKGPNPEYPWPPTWPTISPLDYSYIEWKDWNHSEAGRRLRYFVKNLLDNYLTYFP